MEINLEISLKNSWVPKFVEAEQIGDLAVHPALDGWGFSVTHIPTKLSICVAIPDGIQDEARLIKWCEKVQDNKKELWALMRTVNPLTFDKDNDYLDERNELLEWCKSVEV